ncbi:hypothetical protein GOP47_0020493 [Adiantum capillus-veneris]|uniref:Uncharacterized protein n=1 Tax=Adiantum capillus-veneris TaxID=13818 RepID=A0A9D4U994_ADICA|nr:hypothetical protein GOP47_0020493 [Adiantum capillus-veneris]
MSACSICACERRSKANTRNKLINGSGGIYRSGQQVHNVGYSNRDSARTPEYFPVGSKTAWHRRTGQQHTDGQDSSAQAGSYGTLNRCRSSLISRPSTFAKAAKLKRIAVAKERELVQLRHSHGKEQDWPFLWHILNPNVLQVLVYAILVYRYWGSPLLTIPSQSIYPLDSTISWRTAALQNNGAVKIGILPWLLVCSRVCIFLAKKAIS